MNRLVVVVYPFYYLINSIRAVVVAVGVDESLINIIGLKSNIVKTSLKTFAAPLIDR